MPPDSPDPPVLVVERDIMLAALLVSRLRAGGLKVEHVDEVPSGHDVLRQRTGTVVVFGPSACTTESVGAVTALLRQGCRVLATAPTLDTAGAALLLAGASGFLVLEDETTDDLVNSVRTVASGAAALHPDVASQVLHDWRRLQTVAPTVTPLSITTREREVLDSISEGLTTRMMASRLGVKEKTVEAHKARLYAKLGARSQTHAVRRAQELGLL